MVIARGFQDTLETTSNCLRTISCLRGNEIKWLRYRITRIQLQHLILLVVFHNRADPTRKNEIFQNKKKIESGLPPLHSLPRLGALTDLVFRPNPVRRSTGAPTFRLLSAAIWLSLADPEKSSRKSIEPLDTLCHRAFAKLADPS